MLINKCSIFILFLSSFVNSEEIITIEEIKELKERVKALETKNDCNCDLSQITSNIADLQLDMVFVREKINNLDKSLTTTNGKVQDLINHDAINDNLLDTLQKDFGLFKTEVSFHIDDLIENNHNFENNIADLQLDMVYVREKINNLDRSLKETNDRVQDLIDHDMLNDDRLDDINAKVDKFEEINEATSDQVKELEETNNPIGTIIGWIHNLETSNEQIIPKCWLPCNGTEIQEPGSPYLGMKTPDLNGNGLFLRGGTPSEVLTIQEDSFADHDHEVIDQGHSHKDQGHVHQYTHYELKADMDNDLGSQYPLYLGLPSEATTETSYASITTEASNIKVGSSKHNKSGTETRPKNMAVQWIMKVC